MRGLTAALALWLAAAPAAEATAPRRSTIGLRPTALGLRRSIGLPISALKLLPPKPAAVQSGPLARTQLSAVSQGSGEQGGLIFDGGLTQGQASLAPVGTGSGRGPGSRFVRPSRGDSGGGGRPGWYRRLNDTFGFRSKSQSRAFNGILGGALIGSLAPVFYGAAPLYAATYIAGAAMAVPFLVMVGLGVTNAVQAYRGRSRPDEKAGSRRPLRLAVLGFALGLSLTTIPQYYKGEILETAASVVLGDAGVRHVSAAGFDSALTARLDDFATGRAVLERLKDRGGKIRLPTFMVARMGHGTAARYQSQLDVVFISAEAIELSGFTVDQFMADAKARAEFIRRFDSILVHELHHAGQSRHDVGLGENSLRGVNVEIEWEAFIVAHRYTQEKLRADPTAPMSSLEMGLYEAGLQDFDDYLAEISSEDSYRSLPRYDREFHRRRFAAYRASWPEHVAEGRALLERRAELLYGK